MTRDEIRDVLAYVVAEGGSWVVGPQEAAAILAVMTFDPTPAPSAPPEESHE